MLQNKVTKILNICLWFLELIFNGNCCISHIEKPSPVHILLMLQHRILPKIGTCHVISSMTMSLFMVSLICWAVPAQLDFGANCTVNAHLPWHSRLLVSPRKVILAWHQQFGPWYLFLDGSNGIMGRMMVKGQGSVQQSAQELVA